MLFLSLVFRSSFNTTLGYYVGNNFSISHRRKIVWAQLDADFELHKIIVKRFW